MTSLTLSLLENVSVELALGITGLMLELQMLMQRKKIRVSQHVTHLEMVETDEVIILSNTYT